MGIPASTPLRTMDLSRWIDALRFMPADEQSGWARGAVAVLMLVALVLWLEFRYFRRRQQAGAWLALRLVSLLAAPLALFAVLGPTFAVSGMEGLAVFYATLFTLAPLIWFGAHIGAGRLLGLGRGEGLALSLSGLLLFGLPGAAVFLASGPLEAAARHQEDNPPGPGEPLAHAVQPVQRFQVPGVGTVFAQSLIAPPGLRLERLDLRVGELWQDSAGVSQSRFCRQGADLHLLWSSHEPTPWLRLHWTDADGGRHAAAHRPQPQDGPAADFTVAFREDGFDVAAPVPLYRANFALARGASGGWNHISLLNATQPGEHPRGCLMPGYQRARWQNEGPVQAVMLVFERAGQPATLAEFSRSPP